MSSSASTSHRPSRTKYKMLSNKDNDDEPMTSTVTSQLNPPPEGQPRYYKQITTLKKFLHRNTYSGSLLFNILAFSLPATYSTLSKLWIAKIDTSMVVTTDIYTYIGVIVEVLNEGLPRAAWSTIGDKSTRSVRSRIGLAWTLISIQTLLGILLTVVFLGSAEKLAGAFVPREVRRASLTYVRISSVQALSSAVEVSVSSATRALDHPDVPLVISASKFVVNIVLDLLFISRFRVTRKGEGELSVNTQAWIRMGCDVVAAACGTVYFFWIVRRILKRGVTRRSHDVDGGNEVRGSETAITPGLGTTRPSLRYLTVLIKPGAWTFLESALRNAIYLWLISGIVDMGSDYATAWGVFNTIRWGVIMVPVQSLEASTLAFVGHDWGNFRAEIGPEIRRPKATRKDLNRITHHAWISCCIALIVEVPFCLFLSFWGIKSFAFYLSGSEAVSKITQRMWKTIDWTYIFYALSTQIASILLATTPRWYFFQALGSNLLWMLPWAIAVTKVGMTPQNAWTYHSIVFGGSLVFSFCNVSIITGLWALLISRGKVRVSAVKAD